MLQQLCHYSERDKHRFGDIDRKNIDKSMEKDHNTIVLQGHTEDLKKKKTLVKEAVLNCTAYRIDFNSNFKLLDDGDDIFHIFLWYKILL